MSKFYRANQDRTFILRLWQEPPPGLKDPATWRLSLQDTHTRVRRGFASLEEFFAYLELYCVEDTDA